MSPGPEELCCVGTILSKLCLQKFLLPIQEASPALSEKDGPALKQVT